MQIVIEWTPNNRKKTRNFATDENSLVLCWIMMICQIYMIFFYNFPTHTQDSSLISIVFLLVFANKHKCSFISFMEKWYISEQSKWLIWRHITKCCKDLPIRITTSWKSVSFFSWAQSKSHFPVEIKKKPTKKVNIEFVSFPSFQWISENVNWRCTFEHWKCTWSGENTISEDSDYNDRSGS